MKTVYYEFELTIKAVSETSSQVIKVAEVNQWGDIVFENPTGSRSARIVAEAAEKFREDFQGFLKD